MLSANGALSVLEGLHFERFLLPSSWRTCFRPSGLKVIKLLNTLGLWLRTAVSLEFFFSFKLLRELFNPPLESKSCRKTWHPHQTYHWAMEHMVHRRNLFWKSTVDIKKKKVSSKVVRQDQNHTLVPPTTFQRAYLGKLKLHSPTQILPTPLLLRKT